MRRGTSLALVTGAEDGGCPIFPSTSGIMWKPGAELGNKIPVGSGGNSTFHQDFMRRAPSSRMSRHQHVSLDEPVVSKCDGMYWNLMCDLSIGTDHDIHSQRSDSRVLLVEDESSSGRVGRSGNRWLNAVYHQNSLPLWVIVLLVILFPLGIFVFMYRHSHRTNR